MTRQTIAASVIAALFSGSTAAAEPSEEQSAQRRHAMIESIAARWCQREISVPYDQCMRAKRPMAAKDVDALLTTQEGNAKKAAAEDEARRRAAIERQEETRRRAQTQAAAFEEQQRQAEQPDPRLKDRKFVTWELSLLSCYSKIEKARAKGMIDNERQGARAGLGIIDKEEVYKWQGEIVIMSKLDRLVASTAKQSRLSQATCKAPASHRSAFAECIDEARQQPTIEVGDDADEYLASARRIVDYAPGCIGAN